jgi:D-alanyl-D-alanine carboxypeptidase (penicillin-binding protein 5/6)
MKLLTYASERLFYLAMLGFVFIASFSFGYKNEVSAQKPIYYKVRDDLSPIPILKYGYEIPFLSAQGAMAIDLDSRVILYQKEPDLALLTASTTKIMTALVALDYFSMDTTLTVNKVAVEGRKMGLYQGMKFRFEDLLDALLIYSANDAAEVIADNYPGGREAFIAAMNKKAQSLNMKNTSFSNPVGLDAIDNMSTSRDMLALSEVALKNKKFAEIVRTQEKDLSDEEGLVDYRLTNTNELLGKVDGVLGVKTGWTENARENLVTYIERDNHRILLAVFGSQDRFGETEKLIDWIFGSYDWRAPQVPYLEP